MTYEEYLEKVDELSARLDNATAGEIEIRFDELGKFQSDYMTAIANEYKADTEAKKVISALLNYAVFESVTGNSIQYVDTKELADEIDNILMDEIGDYLLDVQIYEDDGKYAIDVIFGGAFVPYWDGWS